MQLVCLHHRRLLVHISVADDDVVVVVDVVRVVGAEDPSSTVVLNPRPLTEVVCVRMAFSLDDDPGGTEWFRLSRNLLVRLD